MNEFNFKKGIIKGIKFILIGLGAVAIFTSFSEVSLWSLLEQYLKPILGALSVGGLITLVLNFVKTKYGGKRKK